MKVIKAHLKESMLPADKVEMYHKVYRKVFDKLDRDFDNYAIALASELPEYDPNWCAEAKSRMEMNMERYQDSFAIAITNMLLDKME